MVLFAFGPEYRVNFVVNQLCTVLIYNLYYTSIQMVTAVALLLNGCNTKITSL